MSSPILQVDEYRGQLLSQIQEGCFGMNKTLRESHVILANLVSINLLTSSNGCRGDLCREDRYSDFFETHANA
jgi:hypothetical protein